MAGIYLYSVYSAVQFGVYEQLRAHAENQTRAWGRFGAFGGIGSVSALCATLVSYPFDLIRTRHSLQRSTNKVYGPVVSTVQLILREEGMAGLYRGLAPSLAQVVPYMGLVFASYHWARQGLGSSPLADRHATLVDFCAGAFSGLVSKTAMMPVDVIRKRLQIQGSRYDAYVIGDVPRYRGLRDCIQQIWTREGVRGFYRGLVPALLKSVPANLTVFVVYGLLGRLRAGGRDGGATASRAA